LQELVYEGTGRREPFANLKDLQNVIRDTWQVVHGQWIKQSVKLYCSEKGVYSSSGKAE